MSEIPDFSSHERDDRSIPGLDADAMDFLAELDAQASQLLEANDQLLSDELRLCKQSFAEAVDQRTEAITTYMQSKNTAHADYLKAIETQLYAQFCEYVDALLHAPSENGPFIITEIASALSLADSSQLLINMQNEEKPYQFDTKKLQESIMYLVMTANGTATTQTALQNFYKQFIRDVVIKYVESDSYNF